MSELISTPTEKLAYSRAETCAVLGVSATSLWRLEKMGRIRCVPGIRNKIFPRAEIERFLRSAQS